MKTVILAGGMGSRLAEETRLRPKPMVEIGGKPMLLPARHWLNLGLLIAAIWFGREFVIRRADRLLFGTDYPAPGQQVPQFSLYKELDLPKEVQENVFRGNARKLLSL